MYCADSIPEEMYIDDDVAGQREDRWQASFLDKSPRVPRTGHHRRTRPVQNLSALECTRERGIAGNILSRGRIYT